jgi:predicted nuclease of predicted toxin-antitoxin system
VKRLKVDENLPPEVATLLRDAGHDATTVTEQGLGGQPDREVARRCREELRAIVTLDVDFSNIRAYPPGEYSGLIVLRLDSQTKTNVLATIASVIPLLDHEPLDRHLWIVEEDEVRMRGSEK